MLVMLTYGLNIILYIKKNSTILNLNTMNLVPWLANKSTKIEENQVSTWRIWFKWVEVFVKKNCYMLSFTLFLALP